MAAFTPATWQQLPAPRLVDDFEENAVLATSALWEVRDAGPEDVVVDGHGVAYTGTADGLGSAEEPPRRDGVAPEPRRVVTGDGRHVATCDGRISGRPCRASTPSTATA